MAIQANAHVSDALSALHVCVPYVFADCDEYYNIDPQDEMLCCQGSNGNHTILVVHMYGQAADILSIRQRYPEAMIIEDCSQAYGATINGKPVGGFGDIAVFSLYPTKNLGAIGDGGMIVTSIPEYADMLRQLREYGTKDKMEYNYLGWNSRLDELQALILRHKMDRVPIWIARKREIARLYNEQLAGVGDLVLPKKPPYADESTYHIYPVRTKNRKDFRDFLKRRYCIPTLIHYPMALNQIEMLSASRRKCPRAEEYAKKIVSLPIHPFMTPEQAKYICDAIKDYFSTGGRNDT